MELCGCCVITVEAPKYTTCKKTRQEKFATQYIAEKKQMSEALPNFFGILSDVGEKIIGISSGN